MKRKKQVCHPLAFADRMVGDGSAPWLHDISECEKKFAKSTKKLLETGIIEHPEETKRLTHASYTCADWLKYKQCYRISEELAKDLFSMDDLSFPLDQLKLPFPTIYMDYRGLDLPKIKGSVPLGAFLTIADVPCGGMVASYCCIITIGWNGDDYVFGGISFDFAPEHMKESLEKTVTKLSEDFPEERVLLRDAFLFAAYLSSAEPDITEDEEQRKIYRPSSKPRYSSVRKWDVGVRYMKEKGKENNNQIEKSHILKEVHNSPRPHIRKAHWHTYRIGPGRKEKKVLWIAPVTVGLKTEMPVVVRVEE